MVDRSLLVTAVVALALGCDSAADVGPGTAIAPDATAADAMAEAVDSSGVDGAALDRAVPDVTRPDAGGDRPPPVDAPAAADDVRAAIDATPSDRPPADAALLDVAPLDTASLDVAALPDVVVARDAPSADVPAAPGRCPTTPVEAFRIPRVGLDALIRDFTGDGVPDVVQASMSYATIWIGLGGGRFAAPVRSPMPSSNRYVSVITEGDVNGDHRVDLLFAWFTDVPNVPYLEVALQAADGTFARASSRYDLSACGFSSSEIYRMIRVFDVDRDGDDDVLTTIALDGANPEGLVLLEGSPSGLRFPRCVASARVTDAGYPPRLALVTDAAVGDFDGDGLRDLVGDTDFDAQFYRGTTDPAAPFRPVGPPHLGWIGFRWFVEHGTRAADRLWRIDTPRGGGSVRLDRYRFDATAGIMDPETVLVVNEIDEFGSPSVFRWLELGDLTADGRPDFFVRFRTSSLGYTPTFHVACQQPDGSWVQATGTAPSGVRELLAAEADDTPGLELYGVGSDNDLVFYRLR